MNSFEDELWLRLRLGGLEYRGEVGDTALAH